MTRIVILVVSGFLLGIGSAAGYALLREEPVPLPEQLAAALGPEQAAPDSVASPDPLATVAADTLDVTGSEPSAAALPNAPVAAEIPLPADSLATPAAVAAPAAELAPPAPAAASPLETERVVRMFGTMKPQEAARVLEQMGDDEVRVLLGALSERKAGAILSSMPPQRAASISRPSLQNRRSTP
jgi:hypothetical protein